MPSFVYCLHFKTTKAMMFYTTTWGILFSKILRKVNFQKVGILIFQSQAVRDCHPVCISAQVFNHPIWSGEQRFGIHIPIFLIQFVDPCRYPFPS